MLAKGKLKKNANKTYSFEQVNDRCDEKCQSNADQYLENVTALWMVERIRHREDAGVRYDLKFTIVPIYNDQKHELDENILENRLKSHLKRTFLLRDTDYPTYFKSPPHRRTDLFSPSIEQSLSSLMNFSPNNIMQNLLGIAMPNPALKPMYQNKDKRLNKGEFYMSPKIMNTPKAAFHSNHAMNLFEPHIKFPDSKEMAGSKPPRNLFHPKPELYNSKNFIDYRGSSDNLFVGTTEHQLVQPSQHLNHHHHFVHSLNKQPQVLHLHQPQNLPVYQMPVIQVAQSPFGNFPFQFQTPAPSGQVMYQPEATTFRYQTHHLALPNHLPAQPLFNPFLSAQIPANKSKPFKESERHTMSYYSPADPVYHHQQSATEAPIHPSTYSPRFNYSIVRRPQIDSPVQTTADSSQVIKLDNGKFKLGGKFEPNKFEDGEFQPMLPPYDVRKINQFKNVPTVSTPTKKPDSINAQLYEESENITIPYATESPKPAVVTNDKANEASYEIVMGRPKSSTFKFTEKPTEKPVLKWLPKKQRDKAANTTIAPATTVETTRQTHPFEATFTPTELTTPQSTKLPATHIFRGKNRFNKRNSSSSGVRTATISPQIATKLSRKKNPSTPTPSTSIYPAYITPVQHTTVEPVTSLSTSISLEVNGERVGEQATTPGYELIPAQIQSIDTNNSNIKLFKASVVPEKFDDLAHSILNHAHHIEKQRDEN